jgi:hypothetical protein
VIFTRPGLLVGLLLLLVAVPSSATPAPVPLLDECPEGGQALGCSSLIDFGTGGSVNILFDQSVQAAEGQASILDGIQNDSRSYVNLASYTAPNSISSGVQLTGGLGAGKGTYFLWANPSGGGDDNKDCDGKDSDSESCKKDDCDKKDSDSESCKDDDEGGKNVTPEPASIMLLGTGLLVLGGVVRRKLVS